MFCPNCGTQIADGSAFCPNCGKPVKTAVASQTFVPPDSDPKPPIHGDTKSADPIYLNGGGPTYRPAASPVHGGSATPVKEKKKLSPGLWILIGVIALAAVAGIVLGILALTGVLGKKDDREQIKGATAGMSKEQVAIEAVTAYYYGDLKTFADYTAYDYMLAARMRIVDYDNDYNADQFEAYRSDALEVSDQALQSRLDQLGETIRDDFVYDHTRSYFNFDELENGYQLNPVILDPEADVKTYNADDLARMKERFGYYWIPSTWCRIYELTNMDGIAEIACINVQVNYTTAEEGEDSFYVDVYVVRINGAWEVLWIDD